MALSFLIQSIPALFFSRSMARPAEIHKSAVKFEMNQKLKSLLRSWYIYLFIGGLLNGVEFAIFSRHGFTKEQMGLVLGAWGLGNLIAFCLAHKIRSIKILLDSSLAVVYGMALLQFVAFKLFGSALIAFIAAGSGYAVISGSLRSEIQWAIPDGVSPKQVWALVNERLSVINIICYSMTSFLLVYISPLVFATALVLLSFLLAFSIEQYAPSEECELRWTLSMQRKLKT